MGSLSVLSSETLTDRTPINHLCTFSWGVPLAAIRDARGQGLLHWAVQRQATACIQELLGLQQAREWVLAKDNRGMTPVHLAAVQDSAIVLKVKGKIRIFKFKILISCSSNSNNVA